MHKILPTLSILINKSIFKISPKLEETNIDIFNFKDVSDIYFNLTKIVLRLSLKFRAYRSISQWPLTISQAWKNNILVLNWTTSIENKARSSKTFSYTLIIILTSGSYCNVKISVSTAVNLIAQLSGAVNLIYCLVQYAWLGRLVTAVTAGLLKVIVVVVMSDFRWGLRTKVWYTLNFHVLVAFWIGALSGDCKVVSRGRVVLVWYCGLMGQLQWMEEPMRFTQNFTARN